MRSRDRAAALLTLVLVAACGATSPSPSAPGEQTPGPTTATGSPSVTAATSSPSPGPTTSEEPDPTDFPPTPPTAQELIEQDLAAGVIDEPTALLYRVYAMFGAPDLPAKYAAGAPSEDGAALHGLQVMADQLPQSIRDAAAPFLVRPTDPTSVFHGGAPAAGSSARLAAARPLAANPDCGPDGWASLISATIPVTVWGSCADGRDTSDLAVALSAIESVYGDEVALMGDPIPDGGSADEGGDANIDVYVVDSCVTREGACRQVTGRALGLTYDAPPYVGPTATAASSGYILMKRGILDAVGQKSTLAHELFHVLEKAHNNNGTYTGRHWHWMVEASAAWAEEAFVPEGRQNWVYPYFDTYQRASVGLATTDGSNEYASFAWPYFMDQENGPDSIAQAWMAFEGLTGFDALNGALSGVLSIKDRFKDFAVRAWNSDRWVGNGPPDVIAPRFQSSVDGSFPKTDPWNTIKSKYVPTISAKPLPGNKYTIPDTIPTLGERYRILYVPDDVQQLVVDFSDLQPSSALDPIALLGYKDGHWERKDLPTGKTTFCRAEYDLSKVIFVLADHSYSSDGTLAGNWTLTAISDSCQPSSYDLDLLNVGDWPVQRPDAGHFTGTDDVQCTQMGTNWHASFVNLGPQDGGLVRQITLDTGSPAYVHANTVNGTDDPGDWQVQQGFQNGAVNFQIEDDGAQKVTIHAQAQDLFQSIGVILHCGTIQRFQ